SSSGLVNLGGDILDTSTGSTVPSAFYSGGTGSIPGVVNLLGSVRTFNTQRMEINCRITGSAELLKTGSGFLYLNGGSEQIHNPDSTFTYILLAPDDYTGATVVSAGLLKVGLTVSGASGDAIPNNSAVTVNSGATLQIESTETI